MTLLLTAAAVNERVLSGHLVAQVYAPAATDLVFELVSGQGDADNQRFRLDNNRLVGGYAVADLVLADDTLDYELTPALSLRIRATTPSGEQEERAFTISVRNLQDPRVVEVIPAQQLQRGQAAVAIDLTGAFDDPFTSGLLARLRLSPSLVERLSPGDPLFQALLLERPWIDVLLFDQAEGGAPATVANLQSYIAEGRYRDTFIHRSVPGFVIQGGGYTWVDQPAAGATSTLNRVTALAPVPNEYSPGRTNIRGTVAMAKLPGNPDSATSEWFFNLADNVANLDNQNGGFTVFGRVRLADDLRLMDLLAAQPNYTIPTIQTETISNFPNQLPLALEAGATSFSARNTLRFSDVELFQLPELSYSASSSSPLLQATVLDQQLVLQLTPGANPAAQRVEVTVAASNLLGETVQQRFAVQLPPTPARLSAEGNVITIKAAEAAALDQRINSSGASDLIQLEAPLALTLALEARDRWGAGYGARNVSTGQLLPLLGLGRYSVVARDLDAASAQEPGSDASLLAIELDPSRASALFLHDTHSPFHSQLEDQLGVDAEGCESLARLVNIDTIVMGGAVGTSIVDLTSPNYSMAGVRVHGGTRSSSQSVVWCGDGDDTVIGHGADLVIFGGNGRNTYHLSSGRDLLQFSSDGRANDRVVAAAAFDPRLDRIELWGHAQPFTLTSNAEGILLSWHANSLLLEGLSNLQAQDIIISYR